MPLNIYQIFGNLHEKNKKEDRDTIIAVVGKRGVGKSYFSAYFGYIMQKEYGMNFDVTKDVVFRTANDFMPVYDSSNNSVIILDDVTTERMWNNPFVQMVRGNILVGRKKHNIFIFIGPTMREMSIEFLSAFDYILEIYQRTKNNTKVIIPYGVEINRMKKYAGNESFVYRKLYASELGISINATYVKRDGTSVNLLNPIINSIIVKAPKETKEIKDMFKMYDIKREEMMEKVAEESKAKLNKKEEKTHDKLLDKFMYYMNSAPYDGRLSVIRDMYSGRGISPKGVESKLRELFSITDVIKKETINQIIRNVEAKFPKEIGMIKIERKKK